MESEYNYPPHPEKKGFTVSGFDEQKCVGKITDVLKAYKKLQVFWFNLNACGFVCFQNHGRIYPHVLMQITVKAAM